MLKGVAVDKTGISLQLPKTLIERATEKAKNSVMFRSRTHLIEVGLEELLDKLDKEDIE